MKIYRFIFLLFWLCRSPFCAEEMMEQKPTFLYKILTYRQWQASESQKTVILPGEDKDFIHFSTEEQLDKIISKYFKDVPQIAVLKIKTDKLQGDLVFETNPGGATKYYHLYKGFIPFDAVVETKIIFQSPPETGNKQKIVQVGHPALRQQARALTKEEILSPEIQNLIEEMKLIMRAAPGVGLAAPQIGVSLQLIVIEDMDQSHLTEEQIKERDRYKVPFHVVINPKITLDKNSGTAEFFEGCLSVPEVMAVVPRAKMVTVECLNERGEPVTIRAHGWYARILQHEIDHLSGNLFCDHCHLRTLSTFDNYSKFWQHKNVPVPEKE